MTQALARQTLPLAQRVPQAPQLFTSVAVSTHDPLHTENLAGHTHAPASQKNGDAHRFPHAPQLNCCVRRS